MTWKSILKYENVNNMSTTEFGNQVIDALEALGFEIKYNDYYPKPDSYEAKDKSLMRRQKYKGFSNLTEEELDGYDGSYGHGDFGHELVITDSEEPYAYRQGFGADTMTIKYLPDDYDLFEDN